MQSRASEQGTLLHGEYVLRGPAGDTDGRLYHATHRPSGRQVVVRFWRSGDEGALRQVLARLEVVSRIRHPALATLEAFGRRADGELYLVCERAAGEPLDRWADRAGIPPLQCVVELAQRLCVGLNAAHRNGLAHDALDPRNVLVTIEAQEPLRLGGKLLDLGVPACMRSWPPRLGAARFMAPEQLARALRADEAALGADVAMNVYSCGALLYYLCTGGAPFPGRNLEELALAHAARKLIPPSRINPQIPERLQAVILRALAFPREERFASMSELEAALSSVRSEGPAAPSAEARAGRVRRRARHGFEERPTSEMSIPPARAGSASSLPPPLPAQAPKPPRSTAPLGSFSGPLPLPPSDAPRARQSTPAASLAEPPALVPISAWIAEPAPIELARVEAVVVPAEGSRALQPYRAQLSAAPRERTRLTLASSAALGLALAASAASAYVLLQPRLAPEPPAPPEAPAQARPVARPAIRSASRLPDVKAVTVEAAPEQALALPEATAPPAPEPASAARAMRALAPRRRAPDLGRASATAAPEARAADPDQPVLREQETPLEPPLPIDVAKEPDAREATVIAPVTPEPAPVQARDERHLTGAPPAPVAVAARPAPIAPVDARSTRARASAPSSVTPVIRDLSVRGSLATSEVRRALDRIKPQLAACYASAARAAGRNAFGELRFEVEIDERGRAHAPIATGSAVPGLERCLERAASKLAARAPDTGTVRASWKVVFER